MHVGRPPNPGGQTRSNTVPNAPRASTVSRGLAVAAGAFFLIAAGVIVWSNHEPPQTPGTPESPDEIVAIVRNGGQRDLPRPTEGPAFAFHSVSFTEENGARVVKIRVRADGDELVVDMSTGRLIATRPSRPTAAPLGKFAAPFAPMM